MNFKPRPGQIEVSEYKKGKMGITAVPGSGKTQTLSLLAAKLISNDLISEDQEILIVTLVNSAVNNFSIRISQFLNDFGLFPGIGYRVRTLHGLAYDIVREQPHLAGLENHYTVADERVTNDILNRTAANWVHLNNDILMDLSPDGLLPSSNRRNWSQLIRTISSSVIKLFKDRQFTPTDFDRMLEKSNDPDDLLLMSNTTFSEYQQALHDRGAVDFDDLIRLAYHVLEKNPDYLKRLQDRWPFILEDEAQDSSHIQEQMLNLLSSSHSNWVRVGDPNQAIFETFTTADPELLRMFVKKPDVRSVNLPHSGRSTMSIINLANHLIEWTKYEHPIEELRSALDEPLIVSTPEGDPQPNPDDKPHQIIFFNRALTPNEEIEKVARSAAKWIQNNSQKTAAILVPRNNRGAEMVEKLTQLRIPCVELLKTTKETRDVVSTLLDILRFYTYPTIRRNLSKAFISVVDAVFGKEEFSEEKKFIKTQIDKLSHPEMIFTSRDNLTHLYDLSDFNEKANHLMHTTLNKLVGWQRTILLPIDEMIITIGTELFKEPAELALTHKIALILRRSLDYYPDWQLPNFCDELEAITKNRYKIFGFTDEDLGFNPEIHKGKIVVSTMHKAKGLEWDRVYLISINNYNFPSMAEYDTYFSEKWFVKDRRNLESEVIENLNALIENKKPNKEDLIQTATHEARIDFCSERLRLFFVGITRAKEELVFTWNTGRNRTCKEALPLQVLREFWEKYYDITE